MEEIQRYLKMQKADHLLRRRSGAAGGIGETGLWIRCCPFSPAELLDITQPTLSRRIMELEKGLGITLAMRGKNGLSLTDDGIFF